jgi:transcriptional regulator with XRE-family HTH domain
MTEKTKPTLLKFHKVRTIDHKKTGHAAKMLRVSKGLSQTLIAERIGVSQGLLSQLENGDTTWTEQRVIEFMAACEKGVEA